MVMESPLIGGLLLLVGVIMAVAGKRQVAVIGSSNDGRACPICAETIRCAAVKCKHCGSEVDSVNNRLGFDADVVVEPTEKERRMLWVARGILYSIFAGFVVFSLLGR
ncbi:zinc ribbon domain-containing protein, partial [Pseudomonas rhodesiae]|uniref:zinc ribbon domain-containing protein n=1 Tax=Pseudomonas rhodesiae TaxID=76760 RepID=UPI001E5E9052